MAQITFEEAMAAKPRTLSFEEAAGGTTGLTIAPKGGVPREATPQEAEMQRFAQAGAGDIASEALSNVPASALQFAKDITYPIFNPVETATALGKTVSGGVQKLIPGEQENEQYADAFIGFFADRYGGVDNLKKTVATDPIGFLADASLVLSGGGALAARAPGVAGTVARTAGTVGKAIDPINRAVQGVKAVGRGAGEAAAFTSGLATGVGGQSLKTAAQAGFKGGQAAEDFTANLRGKVPMEEIVADAKTALSSIREERGAAYRAGMGNIAKDATVLDFKPIENAVNKVNSVKTFKGQSLSPSTQKIREEITGAVEQWKGLNPKEFHTVEGLDALKQKIGDIRDATQPGTPERVVADQVYNSVKGQITKQAPEYAKVMDEYREASGLIKEMEKTLSLNDKASIDTQLRKLQSVVRNNANTNYGRRVALVELLQQQGATNILEKLAGQALSSAEPRGLARMLPAATITAGGGSIAGALAGLVSPGLILPILGSLALQSPRLAGEAALMAGKAAGATASSLPGRLASRVPARALGQGAFQTRALEQQRSR